MKSSWRIICTLLDILFMKMECFDLPSSKVIICFAKSVIFLVYESKPILRERGFALC